MSEFSEVNFIRNNGRAYSYSVEVIPDHMLVSSGNAEKDIVATALFPAPEREIVAGPAPFS